MLNLLSAKKRFTRPFNFPVCYPDIPAADQTSLLVIETQSKFTISDSSLCNLQPNAQRTSREFILNKYRFKLFKLLTLKTG